MNYKNKYLKYKKKYLKYKIKNYNSQSQSLKPKRVITTVLQQQKGGNISWATDEYKQALIETKEPDEDHCDLIKSVEILNNEGRHNLGIGIVEIENNEYFLKYDKDLFREFITGYYLSTLKPIYPYFLDVHSVLKCPFTSERSNNEIMGQVMVVDKGTETIYQYLNRKTKEYFIYLIPDLKERIDMMDQSIQEILDSFLSKEHQQLGYGLEATIGSDKYNDIIGKIDIVVRDFYLSLSSEYVQFKTEFVPLFIKNYKVIIDLFLLIDVLTLNQFQDFIVDIKSDNFMVKTEPYVDGKTHIAFELGGSNFKLNNVCEWHNDKEFCFLYPVDFGSSEINDIRNSNRLSPELAMFFYNSWIEHFSRLSLYSDNYDNNFNNGNILSMSGEGDIYIKFSTFNSKFYQIFDKYNLFKIRINNPLSLYFMGIQTNQGNNDLHAERQQLISTSGIDEDVDFRFQRAASKTFNITTLPEAVNIIYILINGSSVIYDTSQKKYRQFSGGLGFSEHNGLEYSYHDFNDKDVYKTFMI